MATSKPRLAEPSPELPLLSGEGGVRGELRPPARPPARWLATFLFLGIPAGLLGRPAEPSKSPLLERVEVNLVNVEVVVTDKQGNPVLDLTRDDFEAFEDAKPVVVTNFYRFQGGRAVPEPAALKAAAESGIPAAPPEPQDQALHLVIYFDQASMRSGARSSLFQQIESFLAEILRPDDRAMIVVYDGSQKVFRPFDAGSAPSLATFQELEKTAGRESQSEVNRRILLRQLEQASVQAIRGQTPDAQAFASQVRNLATAEYQTVIAGIQELRRFAASLAGVPGRKAILYVGDGFPSQPGKALFEAWERKFSQFGSDAGMGSSFAEGRGQETSGALRELVATANASRVTFFTVGVTGGQLSSFVSAEHLGSSDVQASRVRGGAGAQPIRSGFGATQDQESRDSLEYLAQHTGGLRVPSSPGPPQPFQEIVGSLGSFYSLAFKPSNPGDGSIHSIRIQVKRSGLEVKHRESYRAKTSDERAADLAFSALLLDRPHNALDVRLEAREEKKGSGEKYELPLLLKVPFAKLALLPQDNFHVAKLALFIVWQDEKGRLSKVDKREVPIRVPAEKLEAARGQVIGCPVTLGLRPGAYRVAIGVRDDLGQQSSAVSVSVKVGKS